MAKTSQEGRLFICNVCREEYIGTKRKWTCPICGTADSYDEANAYNEDDDFDEDDEF